MSIPDKILDYFQEGNGPAEPKQVASAIDENPGSVRNAMRDMVNDGRLGQAKDNAPYDLPDKVTSDLPAKKGDGMSYVEENQGVTLPLLAFRASASPDGAPHDGIWEVRERSYMSVNSTSLARETGADPSKMAIVRVTGDEMADTLQAGDKVVVERVETEQIRTGVIYVWVSDRRGIIIRRASWVSESRLQLRADNRDYDDIELNFDGDHAWRCVGRVVQRHQPL